MKVEKISLNEWGQNNILYGRGKIGLNYKKIRKLSLTDK